MIRREGNDPMHYTISRRGKKLGDHSGSMDMLNITNPMSLSPDREVVSLRTFSGKTRARFIAFFQVIGATEEIVEEIVEENVPNIITIGGPQYLQTAEGLVKVETSTEDAEFDESDIIYR
jgi:hypothetical protein